MSAFGHRSSDVWQLSLAKSFLCGVYISMEFGMYLKSIAFEVGSTGGFVCYTLF